MTSIDSDMPFRSTLLGRRKLFVLTAASIAMLHACKRDEPASCIHVMGLAETDIELRKTLEYVDRSPVEGSTCERCVQWVPAQDRGKCGGCKVMKGPVHPQGYCKVFAAK